MKTVGDKLEPFKVTGVKPGFNQHENGVSAFEDITESSFPGKWKVIYFTRRTSRSCARPKSSASTSWPRISKTATPSCWAVRATTNSSSWPGAVSTDLNKLGH